MELESLATYLRYHNFTIRCDVTIFKEGHTEFIATTPLPQSSSPSLCAHRAGRLVLFHACSLTWFFSTDLPRQKRHCQTIDLIIPFFLLNNFFSRASSIDMLPSFQCIISIFPSCVMRYKPDRFETIYSIFVTRSYQNQCRQSGCVNN